MLTVTEFPLPPTGELNLTTVEHATVTPFGRGRLRVAWSQPSWFTTGAVYNSRGNLVRASQRVGGLASDHALAADPPQLPPATEPARQLTGTWLFGGTWFNHFGHFLTESITTLWPDEDAVGLLFVPFWFGRQVLPWQREMLDLAGRDERLEIVGTERIEVERLLVPERPVVPNGHVRPEAVGVWRQMARAAAGSSGRRVFLSRSLHNRTVPEDSRAARRVATNEAELDQLMQDLGFEVVHPERLTFRQQVNAVSGAEVLAGTAGSSLHLSVFSPPDSLVVEIGDARGAPEPVLTQQILAHGCGHRLGHIPFTRADRTYDLATISGAISSI